MRESRVSKWLAGGTGILGVALFFYLASIGAITIEDYHYTEHCAGMGDDLCYFEMTFTAHKDIYIQAGENWLEAPGIKSMKFQRTWGKTWRTVNLSEPWSKYVKYAIKFKAGKTYTIRFIAEKYHPQDIIDWAINPKGQWKGGLSKHICDTEKVEDGQELVCTDREVYYPDNDTTVTYEDCEYQTKYKDQCIKGTGRYEYLGDKLEYEKLNIGCTADGSIITCDEGEGADGNGDGICQSGETCITYELDTDIKVKEIKNGEKIEKEYRRQTKLEK